MYIKPFIERRKREIRIERAKRFSIFLLSFFGIFFCLLLFFHKSPDTKKFEIVDLISGDIYNLNQDEFYFSGSDIVIKSTKNNRPFLKVSEYRYKPLD
jgi:hypothetical protein